MMRTHWSRWIVAAGCILMVPGCTDCEVDVDSTDDPAQQADSEEMTQERRAAVREAVSEASAVTDRWVDNRDEQLEQRLEDLELDLDPETGLQRSRDVSPDTVPEPVYEHFADALVDQLRGYDGDIDEELKLQGLEPLFETFPDDPDVTERWLRVNAGQGRWDELSAALEIHEEEHGELSPRFDQWVTISESVNVLQTARELLPEDCDSDEVAVDQIYVAEDLLSEVIYDCPGSDALLDEAAQLSKDIYECRVAAYEHVDAQRGDAAAYRNHIPPVFEEVCEGDEPFPCREESPYSGTDIFDALIHPMAARTVQFDPAGPEDVLVWSAVCADDEGHAPSIIDRWASPAHDEDDWREVIRWNDHTQAPRDPEDCVVVSVNGYEALICPMVLRIGARFDETLFVSSQHHTGVREGSAVETFTGRFTTNGISPDDAVEGTIESIEVVETGEQAVIEVVVGEAFDEVPDQYDQPHEARRDGWAPEEQTPRTLRYEWTGETFERQE